MLPVITARVLMYNPDYKAGDVHDFQIWVETEVEVLTLNLNARTMRVRFTDIYQGKMKNVTQDIGISAFYNQFEMVKK